MPTYTFPSISTRRSKAGRCPVCGKHVQRSQTFTHTVNPFNRNDDGTIRTPAEVEAKVHAQADAWEPDFRHAKCIEES